MLRKSLQVLFYALSLELTLGGGGRLTAVGPISLRMVLFAAAMSATAIYVFKFKRTLPSEYVRVLAVFAAMLAVGLTTGLISEARSTYILEDIKPLCYFFLLPYLYFSIQDIQTIKNLSTIFKYSAVGMSMVFIAVLLSIHTGAVPFLGFYHAVISSGEFFFRGEITFFYKGFLYLCVGLVFLLEGRAKKWQIILVFLAIVVTVTRGFWISLLLTYGGYYIIFSEKNIRTISRGILLIVLSVLLFIFSKDLIVGISETLDRESSFETERIIEPKPYLLGDRTHSDNERVRQLNEVVAQITPVSAIIGHGFGQGVPNRPIHMEISYLEIFHKQGVAGLAGWLFIFLFACKKFLLVRKDPDAIPFFLSLVFVFIQSLSNQFINNPIGLFIIMVSIASLDCLKKILDSKK